MSKYFTKEELTRSDTVNQLNSDTIAENDVDNTPPVEAERRLAVLAERLLDPIRELWGAPLRVNSGYRCLTLNSAIGGAAESMHLLGEAADITTGTISGNKRLFDKIVAAHKRGEIRFTQLIDEKNYQWLHVGYDENNLKNQILHL